MPNVLASGPSDGDSPWQILTDSLLFHLFSFLPPETLLKASEVWNCKQPVSLRCYADMREFTWKYTQFSQFNETDTLLLVSGVHFGSHSTSGEIVVFNLAAGFELQCRVLNKPYDIFGTWYNRRHLLSGNLHWMGNLTSCSVLWLNKAYQALESEKESVVMRMYKFRNVNASSIRTILVARCLGPDLTAQPVVSETDSQSSHMKTFEVKRHIRGLGSQSRVSQETGKCGEGGTDEASKDKPGTIWYDSVYRQAENLMDREAAKDKTSAAWQQYIDLLTDNQQQQGREDSDSGSEIRFGSDSEEDNVPMPLDIAAGFCEQCGAGHASHSCNEGMNQAGEHLTDSSQPGIEQGESSGQTDLSFMLTPDMEEILATEDKYLIFTMGTQTYTPHQIGIKRIRSHDTIRELMTPRPRVSPAEEENPEDEDGQRGGEPEKFDFIDHLIELHGHIIGMCLSPDHRYLYVNSRAWPQGYKIEDPVYPPPIAQEIDIHVIDLLTMKQVGMTHQSHRAYTPNDECFFIFLDVCDEYVASGAEDKHGYLWDRHYGVCLGKFQHSDVVNSVAFNPADSEMLITVSDDHAMKIWRSRNREHQRTVCTDI